MYKLLKEASLLTLVAFLLGACGGSLNEGNTDVAIDGPPPSREWQLVWSDEFNSAELDPDNWEIQIGDGKAYGLNKWGNGEDQYYTDSPDNIRVEDGNMVISSLGDGVPMSDVDPVYGNPNTDYPFTSARVTTSERFEFTYGRVEARIKIQSAPGLWQAFWLLGSNSSPYVTWPQKGEIDIMEAWKVGESIIGGAAHFGTSGGRNQYRSKDASVDYDDGEYHLYAVEWDGEQIRWFVDGEHFYTLAQKSYWNYYEDSTNGWQGYVDKNGDDIDDNLEANKYLEYQVATVNAPFDQDQYIIFNTAVNGSLPTSASLSADPTASYLGDMMVDYVRVYQCESDPLLPPGTGCKSYLDTDVGEAYYSNPAFRRDVPGEVSSFAAITELYIDGPGPESVLSIPYNFVSNNTASVTEVVDADNPSNTYILIETLPPVGSLSYVGLKRVDDATSILGGFDGYPVASGDFKFDLYIESYDVEMSSPNLFIGMANSETESKAVSFKLSQAEYPTGTWHRITIPVADIINGLSLGTSILELGKLSEVLRFSFNSESRIRIDNLQFGCGGLACGFVDEVPVFIDQVDPLWNRGIRGNDAQQKSTLVNNPDYPENNLHHVQWEIIDTGEEGHDEVIQTTIGSGLSAENPNYPDQAVNFIGSENAISAIAALTDGEFRFDIRMISNPNNVDLYFKVDGAFTSTGEQPLTLSTPVGDWVTYNCSIKNLSSQGLDVGTITAPFVMVPGLNGSGKDVVFQWDNVQFSPLKTGDSPVLDLPILFNQGGFCLPVAPFDGGAFSLVDNPDLVGHPSGGEADDNSKVGKTTKYNYGVVYGGITLELNDPIEFGDASSGVNKLIKLKAFTPRDPTSSYKNPDSVDSIARPLGNMDVTVKLEATSGSPADALTRTFTMSSQSQWEDVALDFNGEGEGSFKGITIIIDNGFNANGFVDDWVLYFDNIIQEESFSIIANLSDFNGSPSIYTFDDIENFYYPTPRGVNGARANIIDDPEGNKGRIGQVVYDVIENTNNDKGVTFVGSIGGFTETIPFSLSRSRVSVDVYTAEADSEVLLKIEGGQGASPVTLTQMTSTAGWSTLTYDFSSSFAGGVGDYTKMLLIFEPTKCVRNIEFDPDCPNLPAADVYYFDNIRVLPAP